MPRGVAKADLPTKPCQSCGRTITWRKAWERTWDEVRYCSDACRRRGVRPIDRELENEILRLLHERPASASICPSEAARRVAAAQGLSEDDAWRALMEPARAAARRLTLAGEVEVVQAGALVDPSRARGPIRIRRGPAWSASQ